MRIRPGDLPQQLARQLLPIYLVSGDEPLQIQETADAIRQQARQQGFSERDILEANAKFDWNELAAEANSLSLFAEKRIIDLRIPGGKPGKNGGSALVEYAERPPEDTLLLITLPKLDRSQLNSKWVKTLEGKGALIQIWPIEGQQLRRWVGQRMERAGLKAEPAAVQMLTEQVEGNLLAAAQEIDKLRLLHGPGPISAEQLSNSVSDSARFDVFGLVDSCLAGETARCVRMLRGLKAEGTAPAVILWALTREIRSLYQMAQSLAKGRNLQQALAEQRVWDKRKPLVSKGLQRLKPKQWQQLLLQCGTTDRAIKGRLSDDPWRLLEQITSRLSGVTS